MVIDIKYYTNHFKMAKCFMAGAPPSCNSPNLYVLMMMVPPQKLTVRLTNNNNMFLTEIKARSHWISLFLTSSFDLSL